MLQLQLSDNEADEVLFALKLRRHQKRTPYPGVVEAVWNRLYELRARSHGLTPEEGAACYDNSMRVNVLTRNRW